MNSLEIDRESIQSHYPSCSNFAEIIKSIEEEYWSRGSVVCQVILNGQLLDESAEQEMAQTQAGDIESIEIKWQPVKTLVGETIRSIETWVEGAVANSSDCAKSIHAGKIETVHDQLAELFDGVYWLLDSLYLVKSSLKGIGNNDLDNSSWMNLEVSFRTMLNGMISAYECRDFVLLGDALEYDLPETLNKWLEILSTHNTMSISG